MWRRAGEREGTDGGPAKEEVAAPRPKGAGASCDVGWCARCSLTELRRRPVLVSLSAIGEASGRDDDNKDSRREPSARAAGEIRALFSLGAVGVCVSGSSTGHADGAAAVVVESRWGTTSLCSSVSVAAGRAVDSLGAFRVRVSCPEPIAGCANEGSGAAESLRCERGEAAAE